MVQLITLSTASLLFY